jgi:GTPase SAR1 family protein
LTLADVLVVSDLHTTYRTGTLQHAEQIIAIAGRHELEHLTDDLSASDDSLTIRIGVVGEFNAGKSTLINALIGQKALPAMDQPTTGCLTIIRPCSDTTELSYGELIEGEVSTISPLEFGAIATGKQAGYAVLNIPPSIALPAGFEIVDTPGLQSLHDVHTDITFGTLPTLDGVILCHDISRGELTASEQVFITKHLRTLANQTIVALTRGFAKAATGRTKIEKKVIDQLRGMFGGELDLHTSIDTLTVVCSAGEALSGDSEWSIHPMIDAMNTKFVIPAKAIRQRRLRTNCKQVADNLMKSLKFKSETLSASDDELDTLEQNINQEIEEAKTNRQAETKRLQRWQSDLSTAFVRIAHEYIPRFSGVSPEQATQLCQSFTKALNSETTRALSKYELEFEGSVGNASALSDEMRRIVKQVKDGVTLATAIAAAVAGPAAGLGNVGEAAAGGAARQAAKTMTKNAGKKAAQNQAKKWFDKAVVFVGEVAKTVNPIEWVGHGVQAHLQEKSANEGLLHIAQQSATQVAEFVQRSLDEQIFEPIDRDLKDRQKRLESVWKDRQKALRDVEQQKQLITEDIRHLAKIIQSIE